MVGDSMEFNAIGFLTPDRCQAALQLFFDLFKIFTLDKITSFK